ncbi:MAG: repressor LexA [Candidatus Tectomicrobia bacterium]|uniref:Repressor LexA n=1 Tax=Tectimicrobiota bacterium TaxID=2528274 RepID=A0A933GLY1_UNCTE|nr:repressor LexA [Candidatus Tectomicrobia bacterium]
MFSNTNLTPKQGKIREFLLDFQRKNGTAPTYREIASHFGFRSTKAASDHVHALERKGYLRRHSGRSRGIEVFSPDRSTTDEVITVPILGNIQAGHPDDQIEYLRDTLAIDQAILGASRGHRLFALKVEGDSMEGRGIHKGDWVVADADATPREGDVVVALIDGQNTLKTLARQKGRYFLKAENPNYLDLIPMNEMVVEGVIKALVRKVG